MGQIKCGEQEQLRAYRMLILPACEVITPYTERAIERCIAGDFPVVFVHLLPTKRTDTGIVPEMAARFKKYVEQGKAVLTDIQPPWLSEDQADSAHLDWLPAAFVPSVEVIHEDQQNFGSVLVTRWKQKHRNFWFVSNTKEHAINGVRVKLPGQQIPQVIDPAYPKGSVEVMFKTAADGTITGQFNLAPAQAVLVIFDPNHRTKKSKALSSPSGKIDPDQQIELDPQWHALPLSDNQWPLFQAQISYKPKHAEIRYMHCQSYCWQMENKDYAGQMQVTIEGGFNSLKNQTVLFNNQLIAGDQWFCGKSLDPMMIQAEIGHLLVAGSNELKIERISDGLEEIGALRGPPMLTGPFSLAPGVNSEQWVLVKQNEQLMVGTSWSHQGYPFYAGGIAYSQSFHVESHLLESCNRLELVFEDIHESVKVWIGPAPESQAEAATLFYPPYVVDLKPYVTAGRNTIKLEVFNTLHALFIEANHPAGLTGKMTLRYVK